MSMGCSRQIIAIPHQIRLRSGIIPTDFNNIEKTKKNLDESNLFFYYIYPHLLFCCVHCYYAFPSAGYRRGEKEEREHKHQKNA